MNATKEKIKNPVIAKVIGIKMNKTIVVQVQATKKHSLYGKFIKSVSKRYVHDAENTCQVGDIVAIKECKPYSKMKKWELISTIS